MTLVARVAKPVPVHLLIELRLDPRPQFGVRLAPGPARLTRHDPQAIADDHRPRRAGVGSAASTASVRTASFAFPGTTSTAVISRLSGSRLSCAL